MGIPYGLLFLLSPIFLSLKIKDGGYNTTNINKQLSPPQKYACSAGCVCSFALTETTESILLLL